MFSGGIFNSAKRLAGFVIFFLLIASSLQAQVDDIKPKIKFNHLAKELNNNQVSSIFRDKYGFVWIGTLGGLHRFNGEDFEVFVSTDDTTSISDTRIAFIFEDSKGSLWIGTYEGVCVYNRDKNNFIRYKIESNLVNPLDPNTNRIRDIIEDSKGTIWMASQRSGLFYFDKGQQIFQPFFRSGEKNLIGTTHITAICEAGEGVFWIGTTDRGVAKLDLIKRKAVNFPHDPANPYTLKGNYITDITKDKLNRIWIGTNYWGLSRIEEQGNEIRFINYTHDKNNPYSLKNDDVRQVYVDSRNNIWSCNENGGLNLYSSKRDGFFRYEPDPTDQFSVSSSSYWCMYEDNEHKLWIGSSLDGVDIVDKYSFKFDHYQKSSGSSGVLNNNIIRAFFEDKNGDLLIATDGGGLNILDRTTNKFRTYEHDPSNPKSIRSNAVLTICEDNDGYLWIGTWQGGINIMDRKTGTFKPFEPTNQHFRSVFNIIRDKKGNIWISTYEGGISKVDWHTKKLTTYLNDPERHSSLNHNIIPIIFADSRGNIWAGSEDNGLNLLEEPNIEAGIFQRFLPDINIKLSIPSKLINDIFEDSKGNIWIATAGGLCKYVEKTKSFLSYTAKQGLQTNHVKSIIEDGQGYLWLGTSKGISKFDPEQETFRNYDKHDGLQPGEFSRYAAYKTSAGELLFGGTNGFNIFFPDSIYDNPFLPTVYITGLKIFNKPIQVGEDNAILSKDITELEEITLSYKHSVFSLDFIALNYTLPDKNQYAYKLEGLEEEWNYVGNQHSATYTDLDPDVYFFRVMASNNDGYWNEHQRVLKITITPPFWQRWWFRLILVLALAGSVYIILQERTRQFRLKNIELESKVTERTTRLKQLVIELQQKQEEIETTNEELKSTLDDLYDKKDQVDRINDELNRTHSELKLINNDLDKRVHERTSKLVKANQELDRFVYSASHDLSAPLKSILGLIQITKLESNNQALLNHFGHMEKSVVKLENVILSLTQFSRNMGHEVTRSEFRFSEMVDEVLDELKYPFQAQNVKIIKLYNEEELIFSDYLRVKIILTNIISNALKYRYARRPESYVEINLQKEKGFVIIQIKDNGIGIERENQGKIFGMFFRGTEQSKGSGLGLYIVKETLEKIDGTINVESEYGEYTLFTIRFPEVMENLK